MAPRNHADCVDNYCHAILSGEIIAAWSEYEHVNQLR
jgi:hypothetical protein